MSLFHFNWNEKAHRLLLPSLAEILEKHGPGWIQRVSMQDPSFILLFALSKKYTPESVAMCSIEAFGSDLHCTIHAIESKKSEFKKEVVEYIESLRSRDERLKTVSFTTSMGDLKYFTKNLGFTLAGITLVKGIIPTDPEERGT